MRCGSPKKNKVAESHDLTRTGRTKQGGDREMRKVCVCVRACVLGRLAEPHLSAAPQRVTRTLDLEMAQRKYDRAH